MKKQLSFSSMIILQKCYELFQTMRPILTPASSTELTIWLVMSSFTRRTSSGSRICIQ
jgi:hypothetical protein